MAKEKNKKVMLLGIVLSVLTYWLFAQAIVNIVPAIQNDLKIDNTTVNLAVSLTALFSGMFVVLTGHVSDKIGYFKSTFIGLILSLVGSLLIATTYRADLLLFGRMIQGLSAAFIMPATLSIIRNNYDEEERKNALSYWSMGSWGGSGICAFFGGVVAILMGWRWIFIFDALFSLLALVLLYGSKEILNPSSSEKFDVLGLIFFLLAVLSLNLVLSKGSISSWMSPTALFAFMFSLLFYWLEKRNQINPFINFEIFRNRRFTIATVSNFILNATAGALVVINTFAQQYFGLTSLQTGVLSVPYFVTILVAIRIGAKWIDEKGYANPMIKGSLIAGIGVILSALTFLPLVPYLISTFIGYSLLGIGLGFYATPSTELAISNVPEDEVGKASGIYKMASSLGGGFGNAIALAIFVGVSRTNLMIGAAASIFFMGIVTLTPVVIVYFGLREKI